MDHNEPGDTVDAIVAAWRRELPSVPTDSIGIVTRLWHIAKLLGDDRARVVRSLGADMATLDLLSTLRRSGSPYRMTTRALADASLITAGAITQRVDRAVTQGLVTRTSRAGSRAVDVELTQVGYRATDELVTAVLTHENELLDGLDARQRQHLADTLSTLLSHLVKTLDDRRPIGHVGHDRDQP
ncbi:MarR family winged helix-turn-helix transcriptional regulator [Mycolicibacterium helvum]|uniref:MarR family transcriptional regulator n=1 Tax=Mycolicibacterium helvum TaxID=1534349 RepID=A0A7I7T3Q6_9MYCO|nr:MarR family transcriptional regulator [Mycolicibacterium helvum]BBY63922.1 MarR family transcriptional regulator [Mycolicibacterium helvum]